MSVVIMSAAFASLLVLCAADVVFKPYVADILMAVLIVVFAVRLAKTRKFMPSGLMLLATIVAMAFRNVKL